MRPSKPKMLNLLSCANRTSFHYISGLIIIGVANESQSFLFFALAKHFLLAEHPFNPAVLKTHRTISSKIEIENLSLNSAVTFVALKRGFF